MVPTVLFPCFLFLWQLFRGLTPAQMCGLCCFPPEWRCTEVGGVWLVQESRQDLWGPWGREGEMSLLCGRDGSKGPTNMLLVSAQRYWNLLPRGSRVPSSSFEAGVTAWMAIPESWLQSTAPKTWSHLSPSRSRLLSLQAFLTPEAQCENIAAFFFRIKVGLAGFAQ